MLSKDEHKTLLDSLLDPAADTVGICLSLMTNYDEVIATPVETVPDPIMTAAVETLTAENAMLRKTNTELFLMIGKDPEPETEPEAEPEDEKPVTYEDIGF